jgi:hypothetical protein
VVFYLDDPNGRDLIARWKERPGMLGLRFYFNERHKREVAVRRSSLPDTAMRWTRRVPPRQAFNRDQARAAIRRTRERAERLKLGPFEWPEWKSYRNEGRP